MNKKDHIAIFGLNYENNLENFYINAFKKLEYKNIKFIDNKFYFYIFTFLRKFENKHLFQIFYFLQRAKIKNFLSKNHIKFMIIFKGIELDKSIYKILKEKKVKLINIFSDDPFNFNSEATSSKNIIKNIKNFDLFCIWSKNIKKKLENKFKKNIFFYLPFAYSKKKHSRVKSNIIKNKISFVASYDEYRLKIIKKLKKKIYIYGNSWPIFSKHKNHSYILGKRLSKVISESEISLNILKKQNLSSHNMRTFEIPSMRGLMLTNRSLEQNNFFPENKACYMFGSIDELNAKVDYILKNPKAALKVRKKGYNLSKKYTYEKRLKKLINYIKSNE